MTSTPDLARRIGSWVGAFFIGALFGVLGTAAHQVTARVFGVPIPWALALGIAAVVCLVIGLRLIRDDRVVALAGALGVVAAIGLLSLKSAGGSVLVPNNTVGVIWTIAPTLLALLVVVWPRVPARRMVPRHPPGA